MSCFMGMSWGSQYYPPSTQLVIFHLPIAHPAGNLGMSKLGIANLDLNQEVQIQGGKLLFC